MGRHRRTVRTEGIVVGGRRRKDRGTWRTGQETGVVTEVKGINGRTVEKVRGLGESIPKDIHSTFSSFFQP